METLPNACAAAPGGTADTDNFGVGEGLDAERSGVPTSRLVKVMLSRLEQVGAKNSTTAQADVCGAFGGGTLSLRLKAIRDVSVPEPGVFRRLWRAVTRSRAQPYVVVRIDGVEHYAPASEWSTSSFWSIDKSIKFAVTQAQREVVLEVTGEWGLSLGSVSVQIWELQVAVWHELRRPLDGGGHLDFDMRLDLFPKVELKKHVEERPAPRTPCRPVELRADAVGHQNEAPRSTLAPSPFAARVGAQVRRASGTWSIPAARAKAPAASKRLFATLLAETVEPLPSNGIPDVIALPNKRVRGRSGRRVEHNVSLQAGDGAMQSCTPFSQLPNRTFASLPRPPPLILPIPEGLIAKRWPATETKSVMLDSGAATSVKATDASSVSRFGDFDNGDSPNAAQIATPTSDSTASLSGNHDSEKSRASAIEGITSPFCRGQAEVDTGPYRVTGEASVALAVSLGAEIPSDGGPIDGGALHLGIPDAATCVPAASSGSALPSGQGSRDGDPVLPSAMDAAGVAVAALPSSENFLCRNNADATTVASMPPSCIAVSTSHGSGDGVAMLPCVMDASGAPPQSWNLPEKDAWQRDIFAIAAVTTAAADDTATYTPSLQSQYTAYIVGQSFSMSSAMEEMFSITTDAYGGSSACRPHQHACGSAQIGRFILPPQ